MAQVNPAVGAVGFNAGQLKEMLRRSEEQGADVLVSGELSFWVPARGFVAAQRASIAELARKELWTVVGQGCDAGADERVAPNGSGGQAMAVAGTGAWCRWLTWSATNNRPAPRRGCDHLLNARRRAQAADSGKCHAQTSREVVEANSRVAVI